MENTSLRNQKEEITRRMRMKRAGRKIKEGRIGIIREKMNWGGIKEERGSKEKIIKERRRSSKETVRGGTKTKGRRGRMIMRRRRIMKTWGGIMKIRRRRIKTWKWRCWRTRGRTGGRRRVKRRGESLINTDINSIRSKTETRIHIKTLKLKL